MLRHRDGLTPVFNPTQGSGAPSAEADGALPLVRRTDGREGEGPGELEEPYGLMRDSRDRLWIPEVGNAPMAFSDSLGVSYVVRARITPVGTTDQNE